MKKEKNKIISIRKEKVKKIKIKIKINKLFLYIILNSFQLFFSFMQRLKKIKMYEILTNFNYI